MSLRHIRFCDECDKEIPRDANFIGTEGIYIEGKEDGEGTDIVKDEDFCSPECLCAYVKKKMKEITSEA